MIEDIAQQACGGPQAHNLVRNYLGMTDNAKAQEASRLLGDLHKDRNKADYDLNHLKHETMQFAQFNVVFATAAFKLLNEYRQECETDQAVANDLRLAVQKVNAIRRLY